MSEIVLLNGLDQNVKVKDDWILSKVDEIIAESLEKQDVYYALNSCKALVQVSQLSGIALAKFFYLIRENWEEYSIGDEFRDVVFDYVGVHKSTVDRYVKVWEMHEGNQIPESVGKEIRQLNIKSQIPIAYAISQGYEIEEDEWQELADASDSTSVATKVREITGKEPRKNTLLIFISDDGTLTVTQEGETEFVGYLNTDDAGLIAEKAIQRIIRSAGVLER